MHEYHSRGTFVTAVVPIQVICIEHQRGNIFQKFLSVLVYLLLLTLCVVLIIPVSLLYLLRVAVKYLWIVLTIRIRASDSSIHATRTSSTLETVNSQAKQLLDEMLDSREPSSPSWTNRDVPMDDKFIYPLGEDEADPLDVVAHCIIPVVPHRPSPRSNMTASRGWETHEC